MGIRGQGGAAQAHRYTGIAPAVAAHIPCDTMGDWNELARYAFSLGVPAGAVNAKHLSGL